MRGAKEVVCSQNLQKSQAPSSDERIPLMLNLLGHQAPGGER